MGKQDWENRMTGHENNLITELEGQLGEQLRQYSQGFPYPPTPDLSEKVGSRIRQEITPRRSPLFNRLAWLAPVVLIILVVLFTVPTVRAQILEFIQIGRVRIFLVEPTPVLTTTPQPPTSTPLPADIVPLLSDIAGEVSLTDAAAGVPYPVRLPAYPTDLGKPDYVFIQNLGEPVLVMVWMDPDNPSQVSLFLSFIPEGSFALEKIKPRSIQETNVNGQPAIWAEGPYILKLKNGDIDLRRFIIGNVLIWEEGTMTYRLESELPLEDALKIAESLEPYSP